MDFGAILGGLGGASSAGSAGAGIGSVGSGLGGGFGSAIGGGNFGSILASVGTAGLSDLLNVGLGLYGTIQGQLNYERALSQAQTNKSEMYAREDNAVYRRMQDLISSGLSPTLAAGSSAGATAYSSSASAFQPSTPEMKMQNMMAMIGILKGQADITQTASQIELNKVQMEKLSADTIGSLLEGQFKAEEVADYRKSRIHPRTGSGIGKEISDIIKLWEENQPINRTKKQIEEKVSSTKKAFFGTDEEGLKRREEIKKRMQKSDRPMSFKEWFDQFK